MPESIIFSIELDGQKSISTLLELKATLKQLRQQFSETKFGTPEFTQLGQTIQKVELQAKELTNSFKEQNQLIPGSVGALRSQISALKDDLNNAVIGSTNFNTTLKNLAVSEKQLKNVNQEVKELGNGFQNNIKFAAGLGQSIAGAYGIGVSLSELFGEKNKDLDKALLKVQSSMNLLQSIESLAGSKSAENILRRINLFGGFKKSIDDSTNATKINTTSIEAQEAATIGADAATKASVISLATLRAALIATGIGLAVVALTELYENFSSVKKAVLDLFPGLKQFGGYISETKERFVGAFYAIIESIKPVGKFIYDYFVTPFQIAYKSAEILFNVLKNPLSLDNLKKSATDFGNLFSDASKKITKDLSDVSTAFSTGFDKGVKIEQVREATENIKEEAEKRIKVLNNAKEKLSAAGKDTAAIEYLIGVETLKTLKAGSDEYITQVYKNSGLQEKAKDQANEERKKLAEAREKEFADFEKKIKDKSASEETVINLTAQVQINEGKNPDEINAIKDIQITKNKLVELNARKDLYERYKKDVTEISNEIAANETSVAARTKKLFEDLKNNELKQDNTNLEADINKKKDILNSSYAEQLTALQNKNLKADDLEKELNKLQAQHKLDLTKIDKESLEKQKQNLIDYGKDTSAIDKQNSDNSVSQKEQELAAKLQKEKDFAEKRKQLQKEIEDKAYEIAKAAQDAIFNYEDQKIEQAKQNQLNAIDANKTAEEESIDEQKDYELTSLDDKKDKGIITQKEYESAKKAVDDNATADKKKADEIADKEKKKVELEAAKEKQKNSVIEATINTAVSVSRAYATPPAPNIVLAGLAGILGGIQIAAIQSAPLLTAKDGTIIGNVINNSSTTQTKQLGKPIVIMQGLTPRLEKGGSVDYAIVNNYNTGGYIGKTLGYTTLSNYNDGGVIDNKKILKINNPNTDGRVVTNSSIINQGSLNSILNNNSSSSTSQTNNDNQLDGRVVTNFTDASNLNVNRTSNNTSNNNLLANYIQNKKENNFVDGGLPFLIDMGNGQTVLYNSNQNVTTNTSSTTNPLINIGGRYTDDVLAVDNNNIPIARVNRDEIIMTAGVQKIPGALRILNDLNVQGGGAKFPGFAGGSFIQNTNTSTTTNSNSLLDISSLEKLLTDIKEQVSKPSRSYVVESDITEVQQRVQTIKDRASI